MYEKDIFENNEFAANSSMATVSAVMAGIVTIFWLCCFMGANIFVFTESTIRYALISCPVDIAFMITPYIYKKFKPEYLRKEGFKYFVVTLLILSIASVNMLLPKDGVLLWAASIAVATLYFNPKVTLYAFILASVLMLIVTPLSTIFGAWESNVMCITEDEFINYFRADGITPLDPDSRIDRIYWLNHFNDITRKSEINRWVAMFIFYFLPRFLILGVLFEFANGVSKRTNNILIEEAENTSNIQKLTAELNIASDIQSSVLPKEYPNSERCELYAIMDPAKEVGGDFYDFFKMDDDHAGLVIGDVSGKGVPASLFMMKTQAIINALTKTIKDNPAEIIKKANDALCEGNDMDMFVTCWLGIFDLNTGELNYVSAGHNPPIVKKNGEYSYIHGKQDFVLGGVPGVEYQKNTINFKRGDKLFVYTDGVTEAHNSDDVLYGEDRLLKVLQDEDPSPREGIKKIRESIRDFTVGTEQFDDITMLMVEYHKQ